ncbi:MAG: bacteriohemerythrin [Rhodospirillaceae bacterium]
MTQLMWSDQLSCGVAVIDDDHQVLVNQFNRLSLALAENKEAALVGGVINALLDYTAFHFERELRLMQVTEFPNADKHRAEHEALISRLNKMNQDWRTGGATGRDLLKFLGGWLTTHILGSDRALGRHIVASGGDRLIAPARPRDSLNWADVSILLVDDSPNFRTLIRSVLTHIGIRNIVYACNGSEGMQKLRGQTFDAVLVDDEMPVMDGVSMIREVRRSTGWPDPRICMILMASEGMTREHLREATMAGVHDLLVKPLTAEAVRARLKRHLERPMSFQEVGGALVPVRTAT